MVTGMLGKKLGMTRVFTEDGRLIPVTVLETGPCSVVQRKTAQGAERYEAVQLGFGAQKESRCVKPRRGHFGKASVAPKLVLREFSVEEDDPLKPGDEIRTDLFKVGDHVDVSGISKGKGFQGGQKRHNWRGGPGGHGSTSHRVVGSVGASSDPSRVFKGKTMPGHMGSVRATAQHLEVVKVDIEKNLLLVKGCVPGATGGVIEVKKSVKG